MPEPPLTVRPAAASDAGDLVGIVNAAYGRTDEPDGWTSEDGLIEGPRIDQAGLRELLERPGSHLLACESDGEPVGCVHLQAGEGGACELGLLSIEPGVQGQGVGGRLLAEAEAYAREELGAERVVLYVISARGELLAWYERRGYERTDEREPFEPGGEQRSLVGPLAFEILEKPLPSRER